MDDKEERLLLILLYNFLQFVIHSYVYIKVGHSYRYLGEEERNKSQKLMPDLLLSVNKPNFLNKFWKQHE